MDTHKKSVISAIIVLVVVAIGWYAFTHKGSAPQAATENPSDVVATVNGEEITRAEILSLQNSVAAQQGVDVSTLTPEVKAQFQTQAVNSLVGQALLRQATAKAGITASSTEVEAQLASAKAQFSTPDEYTQALTAQGLTEATLREQISTNLAVQAYLDKELNFGSIKISDEEIKTAYDQIATTQSNVPPLSEVKEQVRQLLLQQKEQPLIDAQIQKLRSEGDVKILI
jgi:FKBP-type peptidyl-prolyl cis-trans isomerase (trigger factor)